MKFITKLLITLGFISSSSYSGAYDLIVSKATVKIPDRWSLSSVENNEQRNIDHLSGYEQEVFNTMMKKFENASNEEKKQIFEKVLLDSNVLSLMDNCGTPTRETINR